MTGTPDRCEEFLAHIDELMDGSTPRASAAELLGHRDRCPRCARAWRDADRTERALRAWKAPLPPEGLADRVFARAMADAIARIPACRILDLHLDALRSGDLDPRLDTALRRHLSECARCAREHGIAARVERMLKAWRAPAPDRRLTTRILASLPRTTGWRRGRRSYVVAAAAAVLVSCLVWWVSVRNPREIGVPLPPLDGDIARVQIEREREIRIRQASLEQIPDAIGAFDHPPLVADRARRPTGNAFHLAMRRVAAMRETIDDER